MPVPPYAGKFFKAADPEITADLKSRGLLFKKETYTHSYPHCWRCDTPLLYYARKSWYIRTTEYAQDDDRVQQDRSTGIRRKPVKADSATGWRKTRTGRSRATVTGERRCRSGSARTCDAKRSVGSVEELRKEGAKLPEPLDLHKPYIDDVVLKCACGGEMRRIPELVDVWFDSGSMPFAQWHYPFENQETFKRSFPADFISEAHRSDARLVLYPALDQLIPVQAAMFQERDLQRSGPGQERPEDVEDTRQHRRSVSGDRQVRRRQRPMVPDRQQPDMEAQELSISMPIAEVQRKFFGTLLNTYAFFALYANIDGFEHARTGRFRFASVRISIAGYCPC